MANGWRARAPDVLALGSALVLAYLAVRPELFVSWTPSDEGVLAQGAERVMRGELPHRDFVALWSGGLDYVNAEAFRLLGPRLATLRVVAAGAWLLGLVAMFVSARQLLSAWIAGALTLCAALWTLPLSPHPLPSWYNLFLALMGTAAVLQWVRSRRRMWLVAAGVAAGASIAVKIVGLYFVAAVLLFFVWDVQEDLSGDAGTPAVSGSRTPAYSTVVSAGLLAFVLMVAQLVRSELSVNVLVHFVVPAALLVAILLWREWKGTGGTDAARFAALLWRVLPFTLGAVLAMAPWLWPYMRDHALGDLARGIFVTPRARLTLVTYPLPGLRSALVSVAPFVALLAGAPFVRRPLRRMDKAALAAVVAVALAFAYDGSPVVLMTWYGLRLLTPVCAALAAWWIIMPPHKKEMRPRAATIAFFLTAAAATASLVQVPFALYTYFLYFVPLLFLALAALLVAQPSMPRAVPAALLAFVLLFAVRSPQSLREPNTTRPDDALAALAVPRGGLVVSRADSVAYAQLVAAVLLHAHGDWMYVWHDSPQIYFLTGLRNPTRTTFEVFDDSFSRSTPALVRALERHAVRVVVLTDPGDAWRPMNADFHAWLLRTYPESERVGRFEVRWRS